ncbi:MAG: enoyl-CoA hydratase/isomerase family protein [Actinomycetota bacterium]
MSDAEQASLVELRREDDGRIAVVTLNRPHSLNAISGDTAEEMTEVFRSVAHDENVWVMVLGAAGERAFSVGADLKERAAFGLNDFFRNREQVRNMFSGLRKVPQPTIASVFGFALGGGFELALSCDIIIAAQGTELGLPEVRVGLVPGGGGTQLLARRVGLGRAKEMIFRGRRIDASEAQQLGIVSYVASPHELAGYTMEVARDLCRSSPVALREAKAAIDATVGVTLEEGIALEDDAWRRVISTEDSAEGIAAFNEKREPLWQNK